MSRCFPFPPPGYERKHRPEDLDLLKEAKCKERKHKKDKERKKDKEKKEKDGGSEKLKDKKDRKEKHKDKKEKHRDKKEKEDRGNKDKEKSSISEESTVARSVEISETKITPVGNSKDRGNFLNEGKCSAQLDDQNGGKPSQSSLLPSQSSEESKYVLELDRRIRDEKSRGSQLPERVDKKERGDVVRNSSEDNGDNKNNRVDKKMDPRGLKIPRPLNEENGRMLETKDKYNETVGAKRGEKQKEKSKENHGKEKNKEKKEHNKAKLKTENKRSDQDLKDDGRNNLGDFADNQSIDVSKGVNNISVNDGNIKKRKDMGTNGFLHESEIRPNKMQRPAPHQWTENGAKLEPFQTPAKPSNAMVIEQIAEAPKLPQSDSNDLKKAVTVLNVADPVAEASRRSPHPDTKYLAEVLTIPKNMADWSEYDDQDWLFSEKVPSKPMLESFGEDVCVWSEAVRIESVDVCALPYVIPY